MDGDESELRLKKIVVKKYLAAGQNKFQKTASNSRNICSCTTEDKYIICKINIIHEDNITNISAFLIKLLRK